MLPNMTRLLPAAILASIGDVAFAAPGAAEAPSVAGWQVLTIFGYLGLLGMLAFFGVRWWKTRQVSTSGSFVRTRQINVVETRRVSPSTSIVLADIKGHSYVIVCSGTAVAIHPIAEPSA